MSPSDHRSPPESDDAGTSAPDEESESPPVFSYTDSACQTVAREGEEPRGGRTQRARVDTVNPDQIRDTLWTIIHQVKAAQAATSLYAEQLQKMRAELEQHEHDLVHTIRIDRWRNDQSSRHPPTGSAWISFSKAPRSATATLLQPNRDPLPGLFGPPSPRPPLQEEAEDEGSVETRGDSGGGISKVAGFMQIHEKLYTYLCNVLRTCKSRHARWILGWPGLEPPG